MVPKEKEFEWIAQIDFPEVGKETPMYQILFEKYQKGLIRPSYKANKVIQTLSEALPEEIPESTSEVPTGEWIAI